MQNLVEFNDAMAEVMQTFTSSVVEAYTAFMNSLPEWTQAFVNLFLLIVLVFLYAIFVWKFYRFIATKNIFGLDLNKYNHSNNPVTTKLLTGGLYFLEYVIILPFAIFFWFAIFTLFLMFLTENLAISSLLTISAVIIAVIRISCYYKEDLARDLAKLFPFTLLAISLVNPNFFNFQRILSNISQIPEFFSHIIIYLIFIIVLEIILRIFDFIFSLFGLEEPKPQQQETEEEEEEEEEEEAE